MSTIAAHDLYRQLRHLEHEPHVRAARKWLKQERKTHYGPMCLPLGDHLYLTAKGLALDVGTSADIFPPIPEDYPLKRLSRRRVGLMRELRENFKGRQQQRDDAIQNIARQQNLRYVGALEIPTFFTLATYAAYLLFLPVFVTPAVIVEADLRLMYRSRWFNVGTVKQVDPVLARVGCKPGRTATTKQLKKALYGS